MEGKTTIIKTELCVLCTAMLSVVTLTVLTFSVFKGGRKDKQGKPLSALESALEAN